MHNCIFCGGECDCDSEDVFTGDDSQCTGCGYCGDDDDDDDEDEYIENPSIDPEYNPLE